MRAWLFSFDWRSGLVAVFNQMHQIGTRFQRNCLCLPGQAVLLGFFEGFIKDLDCGRWVYCKWFVLTGRPAQYFKNRALNRYKLAAGTQLKALFPDKGDSAKAQCRQHGSSCRVALRLCSAVLDWKPKPAELCKGKHDGLDRFLEGHSAGSVFASDSGGHIAVIDLRWFEALCRIGFLTLLAVRRFCFHGRQLKFPHLSRLFTGRDYISHKANAQRVDP